MIKKLLVLYIFIALLATIAIFKVYKSYEESEIQRNTQIYFKAYSSIYEDKKINSKNIYKGILRLGNLPQKLSEINPKNIDTIRKDIYNALKERFMELKEVGINTVHIHLPNNISFLRIHKPNLNGDDLSSIRPSVVFVNKNHKEIDTAETGKGQHAFRFVYPIFYKDKYVGAMEVSYSPARLTSAIMKTYYALSNYFVKQDSTKSRFTENNSLYTPSHHKGYYYDKDVLKELKNISRKDIQALKPSKEFTSKIRKVGLHNEPKSLYNEKINALFTIIPIVNTLTNENVAFLTIRSKGESISMIKNSMFRVLFFIHLTIIAIFVLIYMFIAKSKMDEETIFTFAKFVEEKDTYTSGHSNRVADYAKKIAQYHGLKIKDQDEIYKIGLIHDIGKIVTPESVLLKPGKLSSKEFELMKLHSLVGYNMIKQISDHKSMAKIVKYHHERYDGFGYPDKLKGDNIPLLSRILTIADAFDAMTTTRVYKKSMHIDEAIKELERCSGTQFDPNIVPDAICYFKTLKFIDVEEESIFPHNDAIAAKRLAYFFEDAITEKYNEKYLDVVLKHNENSFRYLYIISVKNMSSYNKDHGWETGNVLLKKVADCTQNQAKNALVFRIQGDRFILLSSEDVDLSIDSIVDCIDEDLNQTSLQIKLIDLNETEILNYKNIQKIISNI